MSQGEEGDLRQYRKLRKTDYYALKGADEYKNPTNFPACELCKSEVTGKAFVGSASGKVICLRCHNER